MEFSLDELSVFRCFAGSQKSMVQLEGLVETMERILDSGVCSLYVLNNFYSAQFESKNAAELMYEHMDSGELRDLLRRIEYIVNEADILLENGRVNSGLECYRVSPAGALITTCPVTSLDWWDNNNMSSLDNVKKLPSVVRKYFVASHLEESHFASYCGLMFDALHFHESPENLKKLGVKYASEIECIILHLGYLNDYAFQDFRTSTTDREIESKAGSRGVDISPESHTTRHDRSAMRLREISLFGETVVCEWHTKIKPTMGRIHFYASIENNSELLRKIGPKVIVGIMCKHL